MCCGILLPQAGGAAESMKGEIDMKSFDDFLQTVDPVQLSEQAANSATGENVYEAMSSAIVTTTLQLLKQYHKWLSEQFEEH